MTDLVPGSIIDDFRIVGEIGRGGMGVVYEAIELSLERHVALKVLGAEMTSEPTFRERFEREGLMLGRLAHPNVVRLLRRVEWRGRTILVMELIEGETLGAHLMSHPLDLEQKVELLREVAAGLDAAHDAQVLHRDMKPSNVLVEARSGRALIGDFGLARESSTANTTLTSRGANFGTAHYIAPEVLKHGAEAASARSDLYSFGCLAYEVFAGLPPFADLDGAQLVLAQTGDQRPRPSEENDVPDAVDGFVLWLMQVAPHDRPETATEAVATLEAALRSTRGESERPHQTPSRSAPTPHRLLTSAMAYAATFTAAWTLGFAGESVLGRPRIAHNAVIALAALITITLFVALVNRTRVRLAESRANVEPAVADPQRPRPGVAPPIVEPQPSRLSIAGQLPRSAPSGRAAVQQASRHV